MRTFLYGSIDILPWLIVVALLILAVVINWEKLIRLVVRLALIAVVILGGVGYFVASRLASWLPRWMPGQGTVALISGILGLAALVALFVLIDWKHLWSRYRWQLIVGAEVALILAFYGSGIYLLVPGVSAAETQVQSVIHLKPVMMQIVSIQEAKEASGWLFTQKPHGKFMVVKVSVVNTSAEPLTLWGNFELYDARGRRFEMATASWLSGIDSINPGLASTATIAFDVPDTHGLWWLSVYPDMFSRLRGVSTPFMY